MLLIWTFVHQSGQEGAVYLLQYHVAVRGLPRSPPGRKIAVPSLEAPRPALHRPIVHVVLVQDCCPGPMITKPAGKFPTTNGQPCFFVMQRTETGRVTPVFRTTQRIMGNGSLPCLGQRTTHSGQRGRKRTGTVVFLRYATFLYKYNYV